MTQSQAILMIYSKADSLKISAVALAAELNHTVRSLTTEFENFSEGYFLAPEEHQYEGAPVAFTSFEGHWEGGTRYVF